MRLNLEGIINQDIKEAMKSKDTVKSGVLRMLKSSIKNAELEKRGKLSRESENMVSDQDIALTDEEVLKVVVKEAKKVKDSIDQFTQGGRNDLADGEKKELEVLEKYLPEQMSEEELRKVVKEIISSSGISGSKEMGKVIGAVMAKVQGKADGKLVSRMVKEELAD